MTSSGRDIILSGGGRWRYQGRKIVLSREGHNVTSEWERIVITERDNVIRRKETTSVGGEKWRYWRREITLSGEGYHTIRWREICYHKTYFERNRYRVNKKIIYLPLNRYGHCWILLIWQNELLRKEVNKNVFMSKYILFFIYSSYKWDRNEFYHFCLYFLL